MGGGHDFLHLPYRGGHKNMHLFMGGGGHKNTDTINCESQDQLKGYHPPTLLKADFEGSKDNIVETISILNGGGVIKT